MGAKIKAPGLKWVARKGKTVPYWVATPAAVKAGYPVKTVNLSGMIDDAALEQRCRRLQAEMEDWISPNPRRNGFDGTFRALLKLYETDPDSSFRRLKPHSRQLYATYLPKLRGHIGDERIHLANGTDLRRWFAAWRGADGAHLPKARVILAILRAAVKFGVELNLPSALAFHAIMDVMEFPRPQPRRAVITSAMVEDARRAAHAAGRSSLALAAAIQFDTAMRQWDVIGQWMPMSEPGTSSVLNGDEKWFGPTWAQIDEQLVLRVRPSKTERTTGAEIEADLSLCPMVMEELARVAAESRRGPLIVDERTGLPFTAKAFQYAWRKVAKDAGWPAGVWNRDLRASGITEARRAGAATDDLAKQAGHSSGKMTARVYDRDVLEAQRRAAQARNAFRKGGRKP